MEDKNLKNTPDEEQLLIEQHEYLKIEDKGSPETECLKIEDKGATEAERLAAEELVDEGAVDPGRKKSWFGWWVAAIFALAVIGLCLYFATKDSVMTRDRTEQLATLKSSATQSTATAAVSGQTAANGSQSAYGDGVTVYGKYPAATESIINAQAKNGRTADYLYYFGNDKSAVPDNALLDDIAAKAQASDADITITAYASNTGSAAYNANLCNKRASNLEHYLIDHGVKADHIKVVDGGQTTQFGGAAYNRRADIVVNYHG